jgi:glucose/arabinose dehydrogenase
MDSLGALVRTRHPALLLAAALIAGTLTTMTAATAAVAAVPPGFTDTEVIGGLSSPTNAVFAPDGRVFVSEKSGLVKTFDSVTDPTATVTADLRTQTLDYWDRGLLGLALDPKYPTRPYLYVLYTYDALPGGTAPHWNDNCPDQETCVTTGRLSRLTIGANGVATGEQPLLTDWCQQYPSHSIGTVAFGPDGALYVSGGDGASFTFADWGQQSPSGKPGNLCGDPPSPASTNLSPPNSRGGTLRSQSVRRPAGEPVTLDGTIVRVDPDTGAPMPGNPFATNPNANAQRIAAYGLRNPFRFAFRPGTKELWLGDVGWNVWNEIHRVPDATDNVAENFGWPCYEGEDRMAAYDAADLTMCETLYPTGQNGPYFAYRHTEEVGTCPAGGSSVSGIAFETTSNYPARYDGALFFADSSRGCVWSMLRGANGQPDPTTVEPFVTGANIPVQILSGPGGDLYYVALGSGQLRRVSYPTGTNRPPAAVATATPSTGPAPLRVQFSSAGTTDPDLDELAYAWDLDGDGAYDDSAEANPVATYTTPKLVRAQLRVTDPAGLTATARADVYVGVAPTATIARPTATTQWSVGETIQFAGTGTDPQDGTLPASAFQWQLTLQHCTVSTNCHAHNVQTFTGVRTGSFVAPDHDYPSFLDLTLTVTDRTGYKTAQTVRLNPRTVELTFTSRPKGAVLVVGSAAQAAPFTRTVIVGSNNSISTSSPQRLTLGLGFRFASWSDGGAQSHAIVAPASPATYHAEFAVCVHKC